MNPKALFYNMRHYVYYRHIHVIPKLGFRNQVAKSVSRPDFPELARRLNDQGVVVLPSYFSQESVNDIQDDYERWSGSIAPDETAKTSFDSWRLADSFSLSQAVIDPFLMALVKHYWGKPIYLAQASGNRLDPISIEDHGAFQWHHDSKRKQVKIMILLTDTLADGQRMDYLPGTHKLWHRNVSEYDDTRFTPESVKKYGEPINCSGPAGSVVVFDTNGIHRGNRNLGARREMWTTHYTAGRNLFPMGGLHPDLVRTMTAEEKQMARIDGTA